jgi:hypothetical protein
MTKDEDVICFYRDAVIDGHDNPGAETMRRFNLSRDFSAAKLRDRPMRWSRYPQLESTNKVTRAPLTNARAESLARTPTPPCRSPGPLPT